MKTDIHPDYVECQVHCSCGNEFTTRSTEPDAARRALLRVPPLLHGQAEARRHRWPGRALRAPVPRRPRPRRRSRSRMPRAEPRYMGGQAVLEGVMMRGASTWAVAVRDARRRRSRSTSATCPAGRSGSRKIPVVRGVMGLAESLGARAIKRAHVVGEPAGPRGGAGLREGDGLGDRRSRSRSSARSSSSCPRSPASGLGDVSVSTASVPRRRGRRSGSAIFVGYLLADRAHDATSSASSSTTAPSTRRSPRTRTTSSSRPRRRSSSRPRTCAAAPTSCSR